MGTVPPKTRRFCTMCEKETIWLFNKNVGHSQCGKCGSQYGSNPDSFFTTIFIQKIKAEKELNKIKTNYIKILELFFQEEDNFSNNFKNKIRKLYNPSLNQIKE